MTSDPGERGPTGRRDPPRRVGERGPDGPLSEKGPAGELSRTEREQLARLHIQMQQALKDLQIQFQRIAQMQAQLDIILEALKVRKASDSGGGS